MAVPEARSVRRARREALFILGVWLAAMTYTVGYCTTFGYRRTAESLTFVIGLPDWIFWGIVAPWAACFLLSFWLAYRFVRDDDMPENPRA